VGRMAARGGARRLPIPQIGDISNLDTDGRVLTLNDRKRLDSLGNRLWHTDASYMPVPVLLGMLHAVTLPGASELGGGETEFADLRAAYDALAPATQGVINKLIAVHDIFHSRAQIGVTQFPAGEREQYPASPLRLVRCHPGSGRNTLYLSAHAAYVQDWPVADGCLLLGDLSAHATQREFVYSHRWQVGGVVIWDNRCTMHRGRPHNESQPRDPRRATTLEHESTIEEFA
jgi:alpha-ketoglutarate-dependent 2,4-dichlorophenoxyacetate dioxygenase